MLRKDWDDLADNGGKGDWYFHGDKSYITVRYGEDRLDVFSIPICTGIKEPNAWLWDGNKEFPTLHPSVRILGAFQDGVQEPDLWHGYLQNGKLVNA